MPSACTLASLFAENWQPLPQTLAYEVGCLGPPETHCCCHRLVTGPVLTVALGEGWRLCSLAALPLRDRVGSGCPGHDGVETWATGKFPCSSAHHGAGASPVTQSCKSWHGTLHLSPPENISVSAACSGASPKHGELPPCVSSPLGSFLFLKVLCSEGHWAGMGGVGGEWRGLASNGHAGRAAAEEEH